MVMVVGAALQALNLTTLIKQDYQWVHLAYPDASACHVRDVYPPTTADNDGNRGDPVRGWRCCCATGFTGADGNETSSVDCSNPAGYPSEGCVPTYPALACRTELEKQLEATNASLATVELACDLLPTRSSGTTAKTWSPEESVTGVHCTARVVATHQAIPGAWQCTAVAGSNSEIAGELKLAGLDFTSVPTHLTLHPSPPPRKWKKIRSCSPPPPPLLKKEEEKERSNIKKKERMLYCADNVVLC